METADRLADLLGALSLASDRARGQVTESTLGATILATRIAQSMGLDEQLVIETFYGGITRTLGCTALAMDIAPIALGDDLSFSHAMHMSDLTDANSIRTGLSIYFAPDQDAEARATTTATVLEIQEQFPYRGMAFHQQAVSLASRLPVPANVPDLLGKTDARWDGNNPTKPGGEDIPMVVRIVDFASVAELYRRADGVTAALGMAKRRSGSQFDPAVCSVFEKEVAALLEGFEQFSLWEMYLNAEPTEWIAIDAEQRRAVAEVSGDFADNKSGWFLGNSRKVSELAEASANRLGFSDDDLSSLALASVLHDIGRCAVPNGIWDKPGPLTDRQRRSAQRHSQQTEEILQTSAAFRPLARLAGSAHERRDGSGYHRGSADRNPSADVLAAADMYVALVNERAWRHAYPASGAAEILDREASEGRLSRGAVAAVLACSGQTARVRKTQHPDGLTDREVEVLQCLARGLPTKQVASKLEIAYKTADNHVQNVYRKIGANTRTAATMYAFEHGV